MIKKYSIKIKIYQITKYRFKMQNLVSESIILFIAAILNQKCRKVRSDTNISFQCQAHFSSPVFFLLVTLLSEIFLYINSFILHTFCITSPQKLMLGFSLTFLAVVFCKLYSEKGYYKWEQRQYIVTIKKSADRPTLNMLSQIWSISLLY